MNKVICIHEGLKLLDPNDFHRTQCAIYLIKVTLAKFSEVLETLGIIDDFKRVAYSIENHQIALDRDAITNPLAKAYKLELNSDKDKERLAFIKN